MESPCILSNQSAEVNSEPFLNEDGKRFAHLLATGDVTVFNLASKKLQARCKLGGPLAGNTYPEQFTFSPDFRFVAVNLAHGEAARSPFGGPTQEKIQSQNPRIEDRTGTCELPVSVASIPNQNLSR